MIYQNLLKLFSLLLTFQQSWAMNSSSTNQNSVSVNTIVGKNMVGYQGWFTCENGTAAKHWVEPELKVDMLPDVSEYNSEDLCTLPGYNDSNGNPIKVFSSQTPGIVNTHFEWMKKYGIDGAFVQEFLSKLKTEKGLNERLNVTKNVKNSAEKYGRAWAIMFDVSAAAEDSVPILEEVMPHFNDMIKNSPMYLRENGKPLVAVWGIGGEEGRHLSNPVKALKVVQFLKNEGYSVFGGMVKNTWKDNYGKDSDWTDLVNSFDVVSPWVVGGNMAYEDIKNKVKSEMEILKDTDIIYSPVVFPGFSWANLKEGGLNGIPRAGGDFYSKYASASIEGGAKTLYTAMFDEVNEGTAIFKTLPTKTQLPTKGKFLSLDIDGYDLESDHYLALAGKFSLKLKNI